MSRAAALLDEQFEQGRQRALGEILYLILDARYEKVRLNGQVVSCAVLSAIGINAEGRRSILGVSVAVSEAGCPLGGCTGASSWPACKRVVCMGCN